MAGQPITDTSVRGTANRRHQAAMVLGDSSLWFKLHADTFFGAALGAGSSRPGCGLNETIVMQLPVAGLSSAMRAGSYYFFA